MKITLKLILAFLGISLIPLVFVGIYSYLNVQQRLTKEFYSRIESTAAITESRINTIISQNEERLFLFTTQPQLGQIVASYKATDPKATDAINNLLFASKQSVDAFKDIIILDNTGRTIASTNKNEIGLNHQTDEVFIKGREKKDVSLLFEDEQGNKKIYLTGPIIYQGTQVGVAVIEADAQNLFDLATDYRGLGATGEISIARREPDGNALFLTPLRFDSNATLKRTIARNDIKNPITLALQKKIGVFDNMTDYRGKPVLAATRYIEYLDWGITVKIDKDEAFASLNSLRNLYIIVIVSTAFLVTCCAFYFARKITYSLVVLKDIAKKIAAGDLSTPVTINSHDEIGDLAQVFSRMTHSLRQKIEQLHGEQIKLEASINSLSVGFIMVDRDHNIMTMNHTARQTLCASTNSPLATISECTIAHISDELRGAIDLKAYINQCFIDKQTILIKEVSLQNRYLKIFISPIVTIGVIGAVVLIDDITEAKIMERSKDEFFSIASHELRTPLTAIRGNTSMIKDFYGDKLTDPDLADMIKDIHESSVRLIEIVNDFLDMSRLEQGKMEFKKSSINVASLIEAVIKEYQVTGSQKKIALEFHPPQGTLPQAYADLNKAKQVLINLIGNALKFTEQGKITISTQVIVGFVKILVSDTGRGISQANQNLLFRKFQQANTSLLTRDTTKGTGLGLYISRLIMQGMGGAIKLESSIEGQGTTFSFTLPIVTQEQLTVPATTETINVDTKTGLEQTTKVS